MFKCAGAVNNFADYVFFHEIKIIKNSSTQLIICITNGQTILVNKNYNNI